MVLARGIDLGRGISLEERLSLGWSGDNCTRSSPFSALSLARSLLFFNDYRPPGWDSSSVTSPRALGRKLQRKQRAPLESPLVNGTCTHSIRRQILEPRSSCHTLSLVRIRPELWLTFEEQVSLFGIQNLHTWSIFTELVTFKENRKLNQEYLHIYAFWSRWSAYLLLVVMFSLSHVRRARTQKPRLAH